VPRTADDVEALRHLDELTRRLRRDCPWDREQDERSIVPHTVEEAYELADAAARGDDAKLLDELGDVLFQVHFLALLLEERGAGSLAKPFETPEYGWFVVKANGPVQKSSEKTEAAPIRQTLLQQAQNDAMTNWASNLAKKICTSGKISYQIGYSPNPDPCSQYQTAATTTG